VSDANATDDFFRTYSHTALETAARPTNVLQIPLPSWPSGEPTNRTRQEVQSKGCNGRRSGLEVG
jgi:hypothetical protein